MDKEQTSEEGLVEIYRAKNFVAASMTSVYASRSKVTEAGDILIESVGRIEDRHLKASLTLPSLEARSSMSNTKNLYDLSLRLADEPDCKPEEASRATNVSKGYDSDCCSKAAEKRRTRSPSLPAYSRKQEHPTTKLGRHLEENHIDLCAQPVNKLTKQPRIPEITQETGNISQQAEVQSHLHKYATKSYPYAHNPKKPVPAVLLTSNRKARKQKAAQLAIKIRKDLMENVNVTEILLNRAIKKIQCVKQFIDDNYQYTLFILFGTLVYLNYCLFYDISVHLNEEQRYLAKMKGSRLLMKCFYYVMRRLGAPIF